MTKTPIFIPGKSHVDYRGTVSFVNDFHLDQVKRFYTIDHDDINIIRAWQGHKREQKWFCVVSGSFKVVAVCPDDWENPSACLSLMDFVVTARFIGVLYIPGGYANGFKALEPGSKIIVFSDFSVEQSSNDNYRFDQSLWYNWNEI